MATQADMTGLMTRLATALRRRAAALVQAGRAVGLMLAQCARMQDRVNRLY